LNRREGNQAASQKKGSGRFLEKAGQKLLFRSGMGVVSDNAHTRAYKVFFATFCSQKVAFPFLRLLHQAFCRVIRDSSESAPL
jgi:hypothetical protein